MVELAILTAGLGVAWAAGRAVLSGVLAVTFGRGRS
jgi:hypothetical protein